MTEQEVDALVGEVGRIVGTHGKDWGRDFVCTGGQYRPATLTCESVERLRRTDPGTGEQVTTLEPAERVVDVPAALFRPAATRAVKGGHR